MKSLVPTPFPDVNSHRRGIGIRSSLIARALVLSALMCCVAIAGTLDTSTFSAANVASRWSVMASPNQGTNNNALNSVSCTSKSNCTAVGYRVSPGGVTRTLIETWNGTAWSITPSANQGADADSLFGVACISSTNCFAVGDDFAGSGSAETENTLIEAWNGSTWSIVSSANPSTSGNGLSGVICVSGNSCEAVGWAVTGAGESEYDRPLVEAWDGTTWSVAQLVTSGEAGQLYSISCGSPTSCVAVGNSVNHETGGTEALAESWDGTTWSTTASVSPSAIENILSGVSCTSATNCIAVGHEDKLKSSEYAPKTLVESWDGSTWTVVHSPNDGYASVLNGISCLSASSCVAVGFYGATFTSPTQTLVQSWNGTAWSILASPNQGTNDNLNSVSCATVNKCMAVNMYMNGSGVAQTLAEQGSL